MSFNANDREGGGDYTPIDALEPKSYPARVVQLILMGMQPQRAYQGQTKAPKEMMYVGYELSHEFMKDEDGNDDLTSPRWVGEDFAFYNLEADRATSTLRYNAIDPTGVAGGDWLKVVGMACNVTLTKEPRKGKEGQFTNYVSTVSGATEVPGYEQPDLVNPPRIFDLDQPDMEVFKALPEWLRKKLTTNLNFNGSALQTALGAPDSQPAQAEVPTTPAVSAPPPPPAAPAPPPAPPAVANG